MIQEAILLLSRKKGLKRYQMRRVMREIMNAQARPAQIAALLIALRIKGESEEEIIGAAMAMRDFSKKINVDKKIILDTCGTGGDCGSTFNISTISAFVACGAGVVVAKHGNRAVSSRCGSADLLEALGVNINIDEKRVEECIAKAGIGFLFARSLHPAMRYVAGVRKELGLRTIFNLLGPLTNPARATHQLLGIYDHKLLKVMAKALISLGVKRGMVVHGLDGLDEITTTTFTEVCEFKAKRIRGYRLSPVAFGFKKAAIKDITGSGVKDNAEIAMSILSAEKGPRRDIVAFNAGCAIYIAEKARSIKEGIARALESLDSGMALRKLEELKALSNSKGLDR